MKSQYNFAKGTRTDHAERYARGHEVRIERTDGTITVQRFSLEDGAVMLEPDVRAVFKDSKTVNRALRCLIPLMRRHPAKIAG
jgi:hypothetical protein